MIVQKEGKTFTLSAQNVDDIYIASTIIEQGDIIKAKTTRKVRIDTGNTKEAQYVTKVVELQIQVDKIEYQASQLRINGKIQSGVDQNKFHTIEFEIGTTIHITKEWKQYQIQKIEQAVHGIDHVLICLFDREQAIIGSYTAQGFTQISQFTGMVQKKGEKIQAQNFYQQIAQQIAQHQEKFQPKHICIGCSHFWKTYLQKELEQFPKIKNCKYITVHSIDQTGVQELLTSYEFITITKTTQNTLIESFFNTLAKDATKVVYGTQETLHAAQLGAISHVFITQQHIHTQQQLIQLCEQTQAQIHVIDKQNPYEKQIQGLGGICALLRYQIE
jgi:protein pelota